ncbi:MAG: PhnA domain protein, partial [Halomonadaceae bacterium]
CELCAANAPLAPYEVLGATAGEDETIMICTDCSDQITAAVPLQSQHWSRLSDSMWSPVPAVQIMAWRLLQRLRDSSWAQDLLDMLYLDEHQLAWAEAAPLATASSAPATLDANGTPLQGGDTVTLIKDLDVKGAGFTAKRGTPVRNISLTDNPEQIEGRVNGTRIVLLTRFLKKTG